MEIFATLDDGEFHALYKLIKIDGILYWGRYRNLVWDQINAPSNIYPIIRVSQVVYKYEIKFDEKSYIEALKKMEK